jgi:hypothetical protein
MGDDNPGVVVLNFGHPLTTENLAQIEQLLSAPVAQVIARPAQFDWDQPFADQARDLVAGIAISGPDWQRLPIVVNLPGLSPGAAAVLADLHGRTGSFPPVLVLRRLTAVNVFGVAAVVDLNGVRDAARQQRNRDVESEAQL